MYQYVYLEIMLAALALWSILFVFNKKQRLEMLFIGLIAAIAGPIQELWYTKDYWHPDYLGSWPWIEDILFGFAVIGIATVLYETVFSFRIREIENHKSHPFIFLSLVVLTTIGLVVFVPFMNSIYAAALSFASVWILIIILRPDLLKYSIGSAILILGFMFVGYKAVIFVWPNLIQGWWKLDNISGILISGIPLEEYLWFFTMGLAFGPLYEFLKGSGFVLKKSRKK